MKVIVLGTGAIGGYCGAKLARAGHDVTLVARGSHLEAIKRTGLRLIAPGEVFTVRATAVESTGELGLADLVIVGVKTYDNASALPMLRDIVGPSTIVVTFQNGVDSGDEIAGIVGPQSVLAGAAYLAVARTAPGVIEQTGTHRRFVFGEIYGAPLELTGRVEALAKAFLDADIECIAVPDARVPLWEKFIYLSSFAGFSAASRLPIGVLRSQPVLRQRFEDALREVESVARAEDVALSDDLCVRIMQYVDSIGAETRSSLLFDLSRGARLEVEALLGAVVRRAHAVGVDVPIISTLYAILKPYEFGSQGTVPTAPPDRVKAQ